MLHLPDKKIVQDYFVCCKQFSPQIISEKDSVVVVGAVEKWKKQYFFIFPHIYRGGD
jgi:hypothetical protein